MGAHLLTDEAPPNNIVEARVAKSYDPQKASVKDRFSFTSKNGSEGIRRHVVNNHLNLLNAA
jgi:hypothetical protein